jgi:hypothetical protein
LATSNELEKLLTDLKDSHPEFRVLPYEFAQAIAWEVGRAFSKFLVAPLVEVDSEPFRSLEPDVSLLQRRSSNNFHVGLAEKLLHQGGCWLGEMV